ncbi:MAG: Gfo/Idh/MocA family oxidoreductase [Deltaproteobacteria bacterium]|nr:Gfo/Idh/MocA family oxidoreductase [Deltaproteobacteria bacterium]
MRSQLKVLIVGCGSIGRRHLANLKALGVKKFILCDTNKELLEKVATGLENPVLTTNFKDAVLRCPDAAVICTPSSMHLEMSLELAKRGVDLLIEKPLSHSLEGCSELEELVMEKDLVAMLAMCYRFHPVFLHIKNLVDSEIIGKIFHVNYYGGHYLPDWHPYADYRNEYASQKRLGGGVILTSIHSLDNIRWLFGEVSEAHAFVDKVSSLEMDAEDIATAIFRLENGIYVNWQNDFLQRANQHRMVITGEAGTIRCDFVEGVIETYLTNYKKTWNTGKLTFDINKMYLEEMEHFLECIINRTQPSIDLKEGYKTLKLALDVKETGVRTQESKICRTA